MAIKNKRELATIDLIINGQQAKSTLKDVRAATVAVERELNNMKKDKDPAGWKNMIVTLEKLKKAQADISTEIRGGEGSLNRWKTSWQDIAKGFVGGSLLMRGIDLVKQGIASLIYMVRGLSDELADIQKTTGLTASEVRSLNRDLQKIDTRTPVEELRRLAVEAGRLGYDSKEDILGFVRAADQIQVALGDVLGEDATKDMAKIVDIFKLKEVFGIEGALLRVGSAINEIGMASTANEGYVVDFIKRMSGVSGVANISVQEIIALAGTLDSLGQSSEVGSTALSKVLVKMGSDVPTYAKMAGESVDDFRKILERSALEGLMAVLKGVGHTTEGIEALSATLGELGLDGGRVVGILGTLSKNTDEYSRQLGIATKAMREGSSVTDEFAIKNTNAGAIWEKMMKKLVAHGENAALALEPTIQQIGVLTGVVTKADLALFEMKKQEDIVAQSERDLLPLINRYHQLQKEIADGARVEGDLNDVIKQIASLVPDAVTEWGAYGEVIGFNIGKVNDFIVAQHKLLEFRRQERRESLRKEAEDLHREARQIAYDKNLGKRFMMVGTSMVEMKISEQEMRRLAVREAEINKRLGQAEKDLALLEGLIQPDSAAPLPKNTITSTFSGSGLSKEEEKQAKRDREKLKKDLEQNDRDIFLSKLNADAKELQQAHWKYEELRKLAKGNSEEIKRINAQEVKELAVINDKQQKEWLKKADTAIRAELGRMNKISKAKSDFEREQTDATLKAQGKEAELVNRKYQALLVEYKQYGMDTANLYIQWAKELSEITEKAVSATAKRLDAAIKKDKKEEKEGNRDADRMISDRISAYQSMGNVMTEVLSISAANREENAKFEAQMAVYQLAIDSAVAVSSAVTLAAKSSTNVWTMIASIGGAIATVLSGIARAKKLFAEANPPDAPAFRADGGPTDLRSIYMDKTGSPEGYVNRPTFYQLGRRSYVAGEAGAEYVVSGPMLRNPAVADFVSMLEALRQQRYFAAGGFTGGLPDSPTDRGGQAIASDPALLSALLRQNKLLEGILAKPTGINYRVFEEYEERVTGIRHRASA